MASGDLITYDSMKGTWSVRGNSKNCSSWIDSIHITYPSGTYYLAAPVWSLHMYAHGSWFAEQFLDCTLYKYDGSGFVSVTSLHSAGGAGRPSSDENKYYSHNNNDYSPRDISNNHLWKLVLANSGHGADGNRDCDFWLSYGNVGVSINSNGNTHIQGNHVYGCACNFWRPGSGYSSDADFINGEKKGAYSGTLITTTNGYMCYSEG